MQLVAVGSDAGRLVVLLLSLSKCMKFGGGCAQCDGRKSLLLRGDRERGREDVLFGKRLSMGCSGE
jgi:hypothetical protein